MKVSLKPLVFILCGLSIILIAAGLKLDELYKMSAVEFFLFMFFPLSVMVGNLIIFMYYRTGAVISLFSLTMFYTLHFILEGDFPHGSEFIFFAIAPILVIIERWLVPKKD